MLLQQFKQDDACMLLPFFATTACIPQGTVGHMFTCTVEHAPAAQVWVITGDKQETAINIAISCKLILHPDSLLICNADSYDGALGCWPGIVTCIVTQGSRTC